MSNHAKDGEVRFSLLKNMGRSAAHYKCEIDGPNRRSKAMDFGTLAHTLTLTPDATDHVVFPHKRTGNRWKDFKAEHQGKLIVTPEELARAQHVAAQVLAHPLAGPLLVGEREKELFWEYGGRKCGGRLDVLGANFISDLKFTANAHPGWFGWHARKMAYHAQLDWYATGARRLGRTVDDCYLIAAEMFAPFAITVIRLTPAVLEDGARRWVSWFEALMVAEASNTWPAYVDHIVDLEMPAEDGPDLIFADPNETTEADEAESEEAA